MLKWVTPALAVAVDWPDEDTFTDVDLATLSIQMGNDAIVTTDEQAAQVMHNLGMSDAEIKDRFVFAAQGIVLP